MKGRTASKPRLTREDWINAGIQRLVEEGIGAVSVESLALALGVTRGSFYHHFSDRDDLRQAMLDDWAQRGTFDIEKQVKALALDPATTLLALSKMIHNAKLADFDAPFRAWAQHDPMAQAVLEKVDEVRLNTIRVQFEELGFSGADSENRARLFLFYEITAPMFFAKLAPELAETLLLERHRLLTARGFAK